VPRKITQADAAPTHDPEVQYPDIENARTLLVANGWRVRPPVNARQPRPERVYADPAVISAWLTAAVERLGSQAAVARAIGMAVIGPVSAAIRGRPVQLARFEAWQARLAEHLKTAPRATRRKAQSKVVPTNPRPMRQAQPEARAAFVGPQPE
jgi:hypothetical protein